MIEETLSRILCEAASVPVFVVDVAEGGDIVFADLNPAGERTTGLHRRDVVGQRAEDISGLTRTSAAVLRGMCRHCLQEGTPVSHAEELELPVGTRSFHTLLIPLPDAAGNIERIVGVLRDITEQEQANRNLQQSHDLLRAIIEAAPTAIIGLDLDGNVHTVWNPAAERMLGWSAQEVMGHPLPTVPTECQEEFSRFRDLIRRGMTLDGVEVRRQKRDGSPVFYSIYASPLHDAEGHITGNIAVLVDLSERRRSEHAMRRLNRELQALSMCNQILMRAEDEQTLLDDVCRIICEEAGYSLAWVGYAEQDDTRTVRPVAWAGADDGYLSEVSLSWSDATERGRGPAGMAIRSGDVVHVQDFATDPRTAPWCGRAMQCGYRSGIALPLSNEEGQVFGVLLVYHGEANVITPDEIRLMKELAGDLAFGINVLRTRAERQQAQDELRAAEVLFRRTVDNATDGFFLFDDLGRVLDANREACVSLGYAKEELLGMSPADFDAAVDPAFLTETGARLAAGETVTFETLFRRKDGTEFPVEVRTNLFRSGSEVFGVALARDITDRKRIEEALVSSEAELRTLINAMTDVIIVANSEGRYLKIVDTSPSLLYKPPEDLLGKLLHDVFPRDQADFFLDHISQTLTTQNSVDLEYSLPIADKNVFFNATISPMSGDTVLMVARDITERKRAEQILQARLRLMDFALTHSLEELLQATIDEAEELTGSTIGFLFFLDPDQETPILQAWSTNTLERMCTAEGRGLHYSIDQTGVWVDCVRERGPVIRNDYAELPHRRGTPQGHAPVTRELIIPVLRGDVIVSILGVGNKPSDYNDTDLRTTSMLADFAWDIVERKRAEEALRRSERLKTILNEIAGIFLTIPDDEMYEKVVNLIRQTLKSRFGILGFIEENGDLIIPSFSREVWTECQVVGKSAVFPPAAWGKSGWGRAIREKRTVCSDGPFHTPEGHVGIEHFLATPIVFAGTSIGLISVANADRSYTEEDEDILERIAAYISPILNARLERDRQEEKRREAEKALRILSHAVEQSPALIVITDTAGDIEYVNPKFSQITGYSREEAVGKNPRILKSGETKAAEYQRLWETITQGGVWRGEFHNKKKSGELYWESATISPVTDTSGEIEHYVAIKEDITVRKRVERALGESEAKVRSVLDNIGIGVALISPEMEILELNRRMREWFPNIDPEQHPLCYRALNDPPRESVCSHCPASLSIRDGQVHEATTEELRAGKVRNLRILASPVFNASGQATAVIVMKEDITEKLSLEAQLQHAQKMEAVGRLAGGVAHDFNNMLGVIIGYSELALERMSPADPLYRDLQEVRKAAMRSADLTGKLLAFSRKQTVSPKVLDLNETVAGMLKMLQRLIGEDIDLVWLPGAQLWPVRVDPSQIDQIMANLCVNARDAIEGVGKVTIETRNVAMDHASCADHPEAAPGEYVELAVSDDGCGMDGETLSSVCEPFFTTKETGKGTGLGLAIVYGSVKQSDGFINICSEPGRGSTFKIYLPRYVAADQETRRERPVAGVASGDELVLLVEDEPAMLKMTGRMLEGLGYRVLAASSPGEAISSAQLEPGEIDLLISDVIMPEMNGRDLARKLLAFHPGMRCLFMSGYSGTVIARHGVLEQGVSFIPKPFSPQTLAAKVRQVLDGE